MQSRERVEFARQGSLLEEARLRRLKEVVEGVEQLGGAEGEAQ